MSYEAWRISFQNSEQAAERSTSSFSRSSRSATRWLALLTRWFPPSLIPLGCDIDGKCAEDWLLEEGIIFGEPFEPNGKHSQSTLAGVEEGGATILQCSKWFLRVTREAPKAEK